MPFFPDDWKAMRQGVADWIRFAIPTGTLWGWTNKSKRPEMARPYVTAGWSLTPRARGHAGVHRRFDAARVTLAAATTYTLSLTTGDVSYVATGLDTITTIRDALAAMITGATTRDPDIIVLPSVGLLLSVSPEPNLREKCAVEMRRQANATLQVDAYTDDEESSQLLAGILRATLEHELHRETLNAAGWGVLEVTAVRDIPEFVNSVWRGRSGFDLLLTCEERTLEIQDLIDEVNLERTIAQGDPSNLVITLP